MAVSGSRGLKIAQYCLLPQILPRVASLLFSGFGYFAYFMAQVYRGVRLLPEGHPYLNAAEIGNYSIPDVIGAAGAQLRYRKENIDQIIIFYVVLLGLVLMGFQVLLLLVGMFAPQAMAFSLSDYFGNAHLTTGEDPYQDLAFILLDRVFGVPGIFDSCVSTGNPCYMAAPDDTWDNAETIYTPADFPWPFHLALQAMFMFYSTGLLIIACLILLYFVIVIVAETAQTGVPFGKRFNKVWAPIRLVVALGLLIPINNGLNSAQYIVLYTAKLGSNFATNGWIQFNAQLSNGRMISEQMVAYPQTPDIGELLQFMTLAHACKAVQEGYIKQEPKPAGWQAQGSDTCPVDGGDQRNDSVINAYLVKHTGNAENDAIPLESTDYAEARTFFSNGDMTIRFGDRGCTKNHNKLSGHTKPDCGELVLSAPTQETEEAAGAYVINQGYYELVQYLWGDYLGSGGSEDGGDSGTKIWNRFGFCSRDVPGGTYIQNYLTWGYDDMFTGNGDMDLRRKALYHVQMLCVNTPVEGNTTIRWDRTLMSAPDNDWLEGTLNNYKYGNADADAPDLVTANPAYSPDGTASAIVTNIIRSGVNAEQDLADNGRYNIPIDLIDRGWGGAGLWYNHIARANGAVTGAALAVPKITHYPALMEVVAQAKMRNNKNVTGEDLFMPKKGEDSSLQLQKEGEQQAAVALQNIYASWKQVSNEYKPTTGNILYDFINALFGTQGLFDLRNPGNQNVHPLALLTSMGKSLLEAAIRNLGLVVGGEIMSQISVKGAGTIGIATTFLDLAVSLTLGAGILLYYVLPFMPFIYFFFAVGSWVKAVFEAMVGVPLWALAHIRIEGEGLPGNAAMGGYYMIFEIFLRPIMIVFGLIAAVSIFSAMAITLNAVFDIAVVNAGGTNFADVDEISFTEFARGPIDQLFYTVMYAILMYIMAMSSFKMIDLIPNNIMRWMNASIQSFASMTGDNAGNVMVTMQQQGLGKVAQAREGIQKMGGVIGSAAKGASSGGN